MRTLHSPNRPFQCPFEKCQHAFRRANSFWRHLVEDHPDKAAQHSEIYQRAVQMQKENQEMNSRMNQSQMQHPVVMSRDMMLAQPMSPAPIEIPLSHSDTHHPLSAGDASTTMSGTQDQHFFSPVPRFNESLIYRGHFSI